MGWDVGDIYYDGTMQDIMPKVPSYSSTIAAAWQVVEQLIAEGEDIEVINRDEGDQDRYWEVHMRDFCIEKKSLQEAICLAALKVVGVET